MLAPCFLTLADVALAANSLPNFDLVAVRMVGMNSSTSLCAARTILSNNNIKAKPPFAQPRQGSLFIPNFQQ